MKNQNETTRTETYKVYTVIDKAGAQEDRWNLIGGAIDDKVNGGIKVTLDALPLNGRMQMRSTSKAEQRQERVMKESITLKDIYAVGCQAGHEKKESFRVGIGFVNRDASINVVLDALPLNGMLFVCDRKAKAMKKAV